MNRSHGHDVIVVGAGVVGTAIALFLAREGVDVGLVDRGDAASGTSGATMGNLSLHNRMPGPTWDLAMASRSLYEEWSQSLGEDFEFEASSSLMLIEDEDKVPWAQQRVQVQRQAGLDVEFIPPRRLGELDRSIAPDLAGAVHCHSSARLNPFLLCRSLARAAEALGARFYRHTEITGVRVSQGAVAGVATATGTLDCDVLVDAAGPEADRIAAMAGASIPIVRDRGVVVVTECLPSLGVRVKGECTEGSPTEPRRDDLSARYNIHLVFSQTRSGNCLIGRSGVRGDVGLDTGALEAAIGIVRRAQRFIPVLSRTSMIRMFCGVRPYSLDLLPVLGEVSEPRGLVAACGFGDKGFALGAASARLVARSIVDGETKIAEVFSPKRFCSQPGEPSERRKTARPSCTEIARRRHYGKE